MLIVAEIVLELVELDATEDDEEDGEDSNFDSCDPEHVAEGLHSDQSSNTNANNQCVKYDGNDTEAGHGLAIVFTLCPACFEDVKGIEARVVGFVALKGAEEGEDGDSPRPAAVLLGVDHEHFVSRDDEFLKLSD